jgi:hypothetical protein
LAIRTGRKTGEGEEGLKPTFMTPGAISARG